MFVASVEIVSEPTIFIVADFSDSEPAVAFSRQTMM